jgi:hypothetical protein
MPREVAEAHDGPKDEMKQSSGDSVGEITIEPPFTDYESAHAYPFVVEHYDLGKYWNTDSAYTGEVATIQQYIRGRIDSSEVDNSLGAVREFIKTMEKTAGVTKFDSTTVKVGKVAAYARFLDQVKHLKASRSYGNT